MLPIQNRLSCFCGNKAVLHIAANIVFHDHTKHTKIDCRVINEQLQKRIKNC
uniref:Uncharacterized protein n=1 Tax=Nelumbo nucifera TaxID=4432 RepID=A0A822ZAX3_NELNU|nr:TPA_asm: hypothetical protein HUJ06_016035 [Nelumbo nucifera]